MVRAVLRGIVKDDAKREALARAQRAHAVPHRNAVVASNAAHRAVIDGEYGEVALRERQHRRARLHARALLGQHQFAAIELGAGAREQEHALQREHVLAVQVLVQAVVVAGAVPQQQRCGTLLACVVAALHELRVSRRKPRREAEPFVPAVRDRCQQRIELRPPSRDERRPQRPTARRTGWTCGCP